MKQKTMSRRHSSNCFRPPSTSPSPSTTTTNLTTSLYHTKLGIFALTWSNTFLGRSLHLHLSSSSSISFNLSISPFLFWKKHGSHKLPLSSTTILWDLTKAKFKSGLPEPESGFHIAVLIDSQIVLQLGDGHGSALVVRRDHVRGTSLHRTKALFGGRTRSISIECDETDPDPKLTIWIDEAKLVHIRHLKWKFRGSQRVDVDGQPILLSWDVYNWLFDEHRESFALFTFRFEIEKGDSITGERVLVTEEVPAEIGWRKKKGLRMKTRSASSSSLSSASASSACGSVMDWESVEETEMKGPTGFSLLVYAWKS